MRNGSGGRDVPPFETGFALPSLSFAWAHSAGAADSSEEITVTWSTEQGGNSRVAITGQVSNGSETCGTCAFVCVEHAEKGSFTIPSWVIQRARSTEPFMVDQMSLQADLQVIRRFEIPGFGLGEFSALIPGGSRDAPLAHRSLTRTAR
jgi:hypothetical protein